MTADSEIVRLVAEKVMEWTLPDGSTYPRAWMVQDDDGRGTRVWADCWAEEAPRIEDERGDYVVDPVWELAGDHVFDPLANDADACAVIDKMVERGYKYDASERLRPDGLRTCYCSFSAFPGGYGRPFFSDECSDRRRAVCLAALKAMGADIEQAREHDD